MGIFGRAMGGALVGAFMSNGTGFENMGINAGIGAVVGAISPYAAKAALRKGGINSIAGSMGNVINRGVNAARAGSRMGASMYASGAKFRGGALFRSSNAFGQGMLAARSGIARNAATINRYGGAALAGIGTASAAYIGSSVLAANRGYR